MPKQDRKEPSLDSRYSFTFMESAMTELTDNPLGTDGFEFVEFTAPDPERLKRVFEPMGFAAVARHRSKNVLRFRPGRHQLHPQHGAGRPAGRLPRRARALAPTPWRSGSRTPATALKLAVERGAKPVSGPVGPMELNIPAIEGIGGSNLYLVDRYGAQDDLRRRLRGRCRERTPRWRRAPPA